MFKTIDVVGLPGMSPTDMGKLWHEVKDALKSVDPDLGAVTGINIIPIPCNDIPVEGVCVRVHTDEFRDVEKVTLAFEKVRSIKKGTDIAFIHVKSYPCRSIVAGK